MTYQDFICLPMEERREYFDQAQIKLGLSALALEKDFWVCFILSELFSLPEIGTHLTFKGGTSLSKCWNLIHRFSEDIDIVVGRDYLGFSGSEAPEESRSGKERERRLKELQRKASEFVKDTLRRSLEEHLRLAMPYESSWKLYMDAEDTAQQTLHFEYGSLYSREAYIRPIVRLEMGARSDTEPTGEPLVSPYLSQVYPEVLLHMSSPVRTVLPVRTFWEKVMLLHEEAHRDGDAPPKPRLARHYYDVWCLICGGVSEDALADLGLFSRIASHRSVYFRKSKKAQGGLAPGSLSFMPKDGHLAHWKRDYRAMGEMFFDEVPGFDDILQVLGDFERRFNSMA